MRSLVEVYKQFFQKGSSGQESEVNWRDFHLETQTLIEEMLLFDNSYEFHSLAEDDFNNELEMPPWVRLLGYELAVKRHPSEVKFWIGLLMTVDLYYSLFDDYSEKIQMKINELEKGDG